jgi:general secretion pathway protein J
LSARNASRGFTLIELVIAFALLGMIMLLLYSAFDVAAKSWDRAETRTQETSDLRLVQSFLRREISHAFPLRVGQATDSKIAFDGDAHLLHFVTALPGNVAGGGLSMVSLELGDEQTGKESSHGLNQATKALILKHVVPDADAVDFSALDAADEADKSVLLNGIYELRLAYFGRDSDQAESTWRDSWKPGARMPALLRVELKLAGFAEPQEMLFALRLGEEAGCYQSSFQRQCGARK